MGRTRRETADALTDQQLTKGFGCVEGSLLAAALVCMAIGSGFHLRQGWRAYDKYDSLIECGVNLLQEKIGRNEPNRARFARKASLPPLLNTSTGTVSPYKSTVSSSPSDPAASPVVIAKEASEDMSYTCKLRLHKDLPVDTMTGFDGSCGMGSGLWAPMYMNSQYYIFGLGCANLVATGCVIILKSIQFKIVILVFGAISSQIVALSNFYSAWCHDYEAIQLDHFQEFVEKRSATLTKGEDTDFVAICFVEGFVIAAAFAQVACLTYIGHTIVLVTMQHMLQSIKSETVIHVLRDGETDTQTVDFENTGTLSWLTQSISRSGSTRTSTGGSERRGTSRKRRSTHHKLKELPELPIQRADPIKQLSQAPPKPILTNRAASPPWLQKHPSPDRRVVIPSNAATGMAEVPGIDESREGILQDVHYVMHHAEYEEPKSSPVTTSPNP